MKKVILDCDPGHDDAFAIMLAAQHLDLLGVTTVGGNGYLPKVTRNALVVLEQVGRTDIPVYPGHAGPSTHELVTAPNVHGESGLDGPVVTEPVRKPETKHAVDFIVETVMNTDDVTLIATGPLTNIAAALNREPRIAEKAAGLYIMGGGAYAGNWTPAAEFNIWVDAEAAYKVFHSGIDLHMVGVNLTRQCPVDTEFIEGLRSIGAHAATFSAELCDFFSHGGDAHLHDACAVAWVIDPTLIESAYLHVDIELTGTLTRGMTVTDLRFLQTAKRDVDIDLSSTARWDDPPVGSPFRGQAPNTHVAMRLDYGRFVDLVRTTMRNYR
ncbi:MAG: nucleoside hydrolase [Oscillospiraceae bacterium]|nr:nucleoside hydrolase [Oscillospiraceae bacterium]